MSFSDKFHAALLDYMIAHPDCVLTPGGDDLDFSGDNRPVAVTNIFRTYPDEVGFEYRTASGKEVEACYPHPYDELIYEL